jgi:hypothetical protein
LGRSSRQQPSGALQGLTDQKKVSVCDHDLK